jgi:HD-like signal output (HDOD) protein/CheY-like chemotaxis protein
MKPRILFVDDEPNILEGLRLLLRDMRSRWDMAFAPGGAEALAILDQAPHDVVVSDMRMPGMDGGQLLLEVQRRHPETVRIILSGYSDHESVIRTVKLAHQYLSKPCRPENLKQAITKALMLRDVILSPELKQLILNIDELPTLPPLYTQLTAALQDERASLQDIGDIVGRDLGMSASILRLVNSAFFGLPTHVESIQHAVKLLGTETIRTLVLSIHLFASMPSGLVPGFSLAYLWEHSVRVSCFAKALAGLEGMDRDARDDCFVAGMLHDVGILVLAVSLPDRYGRVLERMQAGSLPLHVAEREVLGASHAEVGAYLMSAWGFNDVIVEAVCWHHSPERVDCHDMSVLTATAVANLLDRDLKLRTEECGECTREVPCISREDYLARLGEWRSVCRDRLAGGA